MKKTANAFQNIAAAMLTGIYVGFWIFLSLHHFISPHHHHEKKVCHHAPNEKHLHGEEYTAGDCSVCQIATTQVELPEIFSPVFFLPEIFSPAIIFDETTQFSAETYFLFRPRAPPAPLS